MKHISGEDVLSFFRGKDLSDTTYGYLKFHRERFAYLINFVADTLQSNHLNIPKISDFNILDIGGSPQTSLLKHYFTNAVSTMDVHGDEDTFCNAFGEKDFMCQEHFVYDLHNAIDTSRHEVFNQFSVIVMSEVIEHILVSPKAIFTYMHKLLKDDGLLFVQTPNAAGLKQRVSLMFGKNPYALPPDKKDFLQYGHVREYTFKELIGMGKEAGFTATRVRGHNYFQVYENSLMNLYNASSNTLLPYFLRSGISLCFKKQ